MTCNNSANATYSRAAHLNHSEVEKCLEDGNPLCNFGPSHMLRFKIAVQETEESSKFVAVLLCMCRTKASKHGSLFVNINLRFNLSLFVEFALSVTQSIESNNNCNQH